MKINLLIRLSCLALLLAMTSISVQAGQVYRFKDESGIKTLSKMLPPYAAQQGYEIIDDTSFRVIEKVGPAPTKEEIAEYDRQHQAEKQQQQLATIAAKKEQEHRRQAMLYDADLKASYRTEDELLKKRETEMLYFQNQIEKTELNIKYNREKLYQFQKQAADIELNGKTINSNLEKRMLSTKQASKNSHAELKRLIEEKKANIKQYDQDLFRLRELLI
jgi:hypothetical protein